MFYKSIKFFLSAAIMLLPIIAFGQSNSGSSAKDKEQEKKFDEAMERQLETYTATLKLDDAQVFFMDSILRNNTSAMIAELKNLQAQKVENSDHYIAVQDKWNEETYNAIHKILNETQWAKYLKTGAERNKKDRDKRAAKRQ